MNPLPRILEGESTTDPDRGTLNKNHQQDLESNVCLSWPSSSVSVQREQWWTVYWCLIRVPRKPHMGVQLNFSLLSPCEGWPSTNKCRDPLLFSVQRTPSATIPCAQGWDLTVPSELNHGHYMKLPLHYPECPDNTGSPVRHPLLILSHVFNERTEV